jgi:Subtilase family
MPIVKSAPRLLVKARADLSNRPLALDEKRDFTARPLLPGPPRGRRGSGWYALTPGFALGEDNPWDLCRQVVTGGLGIAGSARPEFAEPDFDQQWIVEPPVLGMMLDGACGAPLPQDKNYPDDPDPMWFRDAQHAQFDAALQHVLGLGDPGPNRVRVAHLDTGYDPSHSTAPERVNVLLQKNFVDESPAPPVARDRSEGPFNAFGHGTGTLGILAGKNGLGGAPFVEVIPIRVANGVVVFPTSGLKDALDYVVSLCADPATRVDVLTMSLGGVASQAWAEAVNALYDAGVFVVTAAGNSRGNLPTRNIVYPARFGRVVAACGVMADDKAYADLGLNVWAGDYGPPAKMDTAMAAYTPNIPWAKHGCPDLVNNNGGGTSSATPQIAAAAALWIQKNRAALAAYPEPWMRIEAVRKALFESADRDPADREHLGHGRLRARDALDVPPPNSRALMKTPADSAEFPILRLFFGRSFDDSSATQRMLELEALQLSQSPEIEQLLADPGFDTPTPSDESLRQLADALANHRDASDALRRALHRERRPRAPVAPPRLTPVEELHLQHAIEPKPPQPTSRRLRVYARDPSVGTHLEGIALNEAILDVRWEENLEPGPVGEYLDVIDVDPASQACYAPVDLNNHHLLVQDGLPAAQSNPQFHQQMAYAVAMKTIEHFERALGRTALWSPRAIRNERGEQVDEEYVQRLRVYPHALRAANAYYSPNQKALLLGYFRASKEDPGDLLPGGLVFGALSHDVIAHETTHALLDGLHRRFSEPTNPDVLAFHEAFADIVALFQHFSMPEALRDAIAHTRGDLSTENPLAQLAVEFGHATGRYGPLRDAIGEVVGPKHTWMPKEPSGKDYDPEKEAHALGSVLVAAVFDAFLQIYQARTRDLVRLATQGTGVLPPGDIPVDLVGRLAAEASKVATHVLRMCIRALDYCPPVDLNFGEYLRALITADRDAAPQDERGYRVAFISAFRARGIYPAEVKSLSVDSLAWEPPPMPLREAHIENIVSRLNLGWDLTTDRKKAYDASRDNAVKMRNWLRDRGQVSDDELDALGLHRPKEGQPERIPMTLAGLRGQLGPLEVHSVRPARRIGAEGDILSDLIVEITQTFRPDPPYEHRRFRGGCTLLIDLGPNRVRYLVRKRCDSSDRVARQHQFVEEQGDHLRATYFANPELGLEPFALLHRGY